MKVFKQLLWFIVPTFFIWGLFFVYLLIANSLTPDYPRFAGFLHYLRLFTQATVFVKAFLNTVLISLIPAILVSVITYICKLIFKFNSAVMYSIAFVFTTFVAIFVPIIFYAGKNFSVSIINVVCSLQIGIICCFICWLLNVIKNKISKKA